MSCLSDNHEKIKLNKQLPYLVANIVEVLELDEELEEDGAAVDLNAVRKGKCVVVKTSTRQTGNTLCRSCLWIYNSSKTVFLPVVGLVDPAQLKPGDLVGVNKDSYLVLDKLPTEFDSRVKAMEVEEKPTENYTDIGGLDKQIEVR